MVKVDVCKKVKNVHSDQPKIPLKVFNERKRGNSEWIRKRMWKLVNAIVRN